MKVVVPTRRLERRLWQQGFKLVAGIDEVGRGPLAGPVTVAAVILPQRCHLTGVRDSKLLTPEQRLILSRKIRRQALGIGIGWTGNQEIDRLGLTAAMRQAAVMAIAQLPTRPDIAILDGIHNYLADHCPAQMCVKADQSSLAVAAASVIAKVARDRYMELVDRCYPGYGFASHRGYGSPAHIEVLQKLGPTPAHRLSWQPVRAISVLD